MNRKLFVSIGCVVFVLFLAIKSLSAIAHSNATIENQPLPVNAPAAIVAPAKTTPTPVQAAQKPTFQPSPQPVPTPPGTSVPSETTPGQGSLPNQLPGLLFIVTVGLFAGWVLRLSRQRNDNGHSSYQRTLAEGVKI